MIALLQALERCQASHADWIRITNQMIICDTCHKVCDPVQWAQANRETPASQPAAARLNRAHREPANGRFWQFQPTSQRQTEHKERKEYLKYTQYQSTGDKRADRGSARTDGKDSVLVVVCVGVRVSVPEGRW